MNCPRPMLLMMGIMLTACGAPVAIIDYYEALFQAAAENPAVVEAMAGKGTEVLFLPSEEFQAYLNETFTDWKRIATQVGMYKGE